MAVAGHDAQLGAELQKLGYPASVVDKAREGYWSDFKSPLVTPKIELVVMLDRDGHRRLAQRVRDGEFDG